MAESCHHNDSQKERGREMDGKGEGHAPHICAPRVWQNRVQNPCHSCRGQNLSNSVCPQQRATRLPQRWLYSTMYQYGLKCIRDKQSFVISYDQEKAYDSVQAYTIKASLERFNM